MKLKSNKRELSLKIRNGKDFDKLHAIKEKLDISTYSETLRNIINRVYLEEIQKD